MVIPSMTEVKNNVNNEHIYFPVALKLKMNHKHWFKLYQRLSKGKDYHALLESGRAGRFSLIATDVSHILKGKNKHLTIQELSTENTITKTEEYEGELLPLIQEWMSKRKALRMSGLPDFRGGLLGFFSYDIVRSIEQLPNMSADDLHTPDLYLLSVEQLIVYDHQLDEHWLIHYQRITDHSVAGIKQDYQTAQQHLQQWQRKIMAEISQLEREEPTMVADRIIQQKPTIEQIRKKIEPSFEEQSFVQAVEQVQKYISAGDVFQVNLSVRQSRSLEVHPIRVYEELRRINPSPYMGYIHLPDCQVISASPEQLIKVNGEQINTRPIAGTRPRGRDREHDLRLAQELIQNEKERAEHVMLVDLERNDLGKVSRFGTVHVDEFMVIEEYSHVMHIVSNVKGQLREGCDAFDAIRATFPGGTITGAPKVRTLEIIEELEPVRRGIYTGSIGWIDFNGDMELNIVIRTMLVKEDQVHVQAGAGIVIDSVPEKEYLESLKKAEALWQAYEQSLSREKSKWSRV